ncbi:MAG: hypothetical protein KDE20_22885, partial [Caldilineaceae bacterium]|nr:hypothetical protein [Caldilineaceae bacterium]
PEDFEAIRFFVDRVHLIAPGFQITPTNAQAVTRICVALDGLPLALELAATQLKYMTVDELLAQLDEHMHLTWTGNHRFPGQHDSLDKVVVWSYDLLDSGARRLMRSLGVFNGGFTLGSARAVHTAVADDDVASQLRTLVNASLLERVDADAAATRFTMLETIRQFAAQRLHESDVCQAAHRAHAVYFLALAQSVAGQSMHVGVHSQLAVLDAEDDNLRAALSWALENNAPGLAVGLGVALGGYWVTRFRMQEGIAWLTRLIQLPACEETPAINARLHATLGRLLELSGDYQHAQTALTNAIALARAQAQANEMALALSYMGLLTRTVGDSAGAKALFAESAMLYAQLRQRHGEVVNRAYTANCHHDLGELDSAEEQYRFALDRAPGLDDAFINAYLLWRLSDNLAAQERVAESKELLVQAAARFTELQAFKALAGYAHVTAAQVAMANQDYPEMLRLFRVSLKHSLQTRFFWGYTYELSACALAMAKLGRVTDGYTVTAFVDQAFRRAGAPLAHRQGLHDEVSRTAKTQLDAEVMAAAWQRGMHMTLSEITALTLADT